MARDASTLRDEAAEAVSRGKLDRALALYEELEELEPAAPNWPKRIGETHRRAGALEQAVGAFERAADKYVASGFLVQAIAVCKVILQIDPKRTATLDQLAALVRRTRPKPSEPAAARAPEPSPAPAIVIENPVVTRRRPTTLPPPGGALDSVDLALMVPTQRRMRDDGSDTGIAVLELELDPARPPPPHEIPEIEVELTLADEAPSRPSAIRSPAARRALLTTPLFPHVPPHALERLITRMSLATLAAGETVFREGERGTSLYIISEGHVAVSSGDLELARLGPGAFFGEIALVTELPRSATIRAVEDVELLAMDRDAVREAAADHPEIVAVLLRFVRDRLIDRVTHTSELFQPFTDPERAALSARFELLEVVPGTPLVNEGERADGLYLVIAGRLDVRKQGAANAIAVLGGGDVFGELSLLRGGAANATVSATSRVLALRLPAQTFQEIIMTHPQVLAYLGELSARRAPESTADDVVDFHLDLL